SKGGTITLAQLPRVADLQTRLGVVLKIPQQCARSGMAQQQGVDDAVVVQVRDLVLPRVAPVKGPALRFAGRRGVAAFVDPALAVLIGEARCTLEVSGRILGRRRLGEVFVSS